MYMCITINASQSDNSHSPTGAQMHMYVFRSLCLYALVNFHWQHCTFMCVCLSLNVQMVILSKQFKAICQPLGTVLSVICQTVCI